MSNLMLTFLKRDGKGKILDNHNEICYSYEYKSSCELYLHIICGCFLCLFINKADIIKRHWS